MMRMQRMNVRLYWLLVLCWQIGCVSSRGGFSFSWRKNNKNHNQNDKDETFRSHNHCFSRAEAYERLHTFFQDTTSSSSSSTKTSSFHIQGWRWHTMSLQKEAEQLQALTMRCQDTSAITRAMHHVVNFNMQALHRIETQLFIPWVRQQMQTKDPIVRSALNVVLEELDELRQSVQTLGSQMNQDAARTTLSSTAMIQSIGERSAQVVEQTKTMLHLENTYLVPTIASLIPESEQKAFNNQVIRNLGIWDSRLHLVSMYEAIKDDPVELALFEATIPSIPRKMIPRWKRLLYEPAAGDL